jgi:hypothetical protein
MVEPGSVNRRDARPIVSGAAAADNGTMKKLQVVACATLLIGAASLDAQAPEPLAASARMPVKEVTAREWTSLARSS